MRNGNLLRRLPTAAAACGILLALALSGCGSKAASIQVAAPADGSTTRGDRITVRGTVSPSNATVQVLGQPAQVGNGVFTATVPLHGGKNSIDVVAGGSNITPTTVTVNVTRHTTSRSKVTTQNGGTVNNNGTTNSRATCGDGITVGPNTTCEFARNVVATYRDSPASTLEVYSPVTDRTYTMSCTSGSPHACTGGNNASVYFP